jgi:peptidoglycan/xylan/chitin deacetylase (PgdA/CDA1 family)
VLKSLVERGLLAAGVAGAWRATRRGRTLVLAYHDVVPAGERPCGDRSLHLPQESFAAQLDALVATHDVVALSTEALEPHRGRPRAIITFDDAYRGALTVGLDELERRGLPATIFVSPGLFGTVTWWDRLAEGPDGAVPAATRDAALSTHRGVAPAVEAAFGPGARALPRWAQIGTETEVLAAGARPGIALGAHTWSHANLAVLDPTALAEELERPLSWLRRSGVRTVPWLAYSYGRTSPTVSAAVAEAGYEGAFRVVGGWLPPGARSMAERFDLPRVNIPAGLSLAGFRLRTAGLLPR